MAAVIVGGRFIAPSGETQSGQLFVNLEGTETSNTEIYRLPILPKKNLLYQIEPGRYRLSPPRSVFGFPRAELMVSIEGNPYRVPFPNDIEHRAAFDVRPMKIVPIGIFEVKLEPALPRQSPVVHVRLDDSIATKRRLVEDIIHEMMDPAVPPQDRESDIAWSRALEISLMELATQTEQAPLGKSGR